MIMVNNEYKVYNTGFVLNKNDAISFHLDEGLCKFYPYTYNYNYLYYGMVDIMTNKGLL